MSRILITTVGSLGDLHPMIAIGLELRDRGHEIVFATLKDYRAKIESLGFEFHRLRRLLDFLSMMAVSGEQGSRQSFSIF